MSDVPHIPILRAGAEYSSLDVNELAAYRDGQVVAKTSQANVGIIRRDLRKLRERAAPLRAKSTAEMLAICKAAGEHFMSSTLPINDDGQTQSPDDYIAQLGSTSGLPRTLIERNMRKVFTVFDDMDEILRGLTRGMDPAVVDTGFGEHDGIPVCYGATTDALGVVLPSNSPGVNSIWMPAVALRVPVVLKPGREEPWTPLRIMQAFIAAGCPREAFSFYPTTHEGTAAILELCGRSLLFGDEGVTSAYAGDERVQIHGPGRSKVLIGDDEIENWRDHLDVLVASVADNGGRSCINASSIVVPGHGAEIAAALGERLAAIEPRAGDDPEAKLSAFANPKFAEFIDGAIDRGLQEGGAEETTAGHRSEARMATIDGARYLRPTVVHCESIDHSLARTEFLFPFTSVVEVPQAAMVDAIGPTLVATAITRDAGFVAELVQSPHVDRLNVGPVPTSHVEWDQPHEGNLFEFLYKRRAIQSATGWSSAGG